MSFWLRAFCLMTIATTCSAPHLMSQSPLGELLRQQSAASELQELSRANKATEDSANAAIRRANQLSRHVQQLRQTRDRLELQLDAVRDVLSVAHRDAVNARSLLTEMITNLNGQDRTVGLRKIEHQLVECSRSIAIALMTSYPDFPTQAVLPEEQLPPFPEMQ